jgi:hypothetical protein
MSLGLGLLVAMLIQTPAQQSLNGEEAKRAGDPVLRQFMAEAEFAWYMIDYKGQAMFRLAGRGRASPEGGICARESVTIHMARSADAPAAAPGLPARIRDVEYDREFHLIRNGRDEPSWDLTGDALDRACADPALARLVWSKAESSGEAWIGVQSLLIVQSELAKPASTLVRVTCATEPCPRARIVDLIEPLSDHDIRAASDWADCGARAKWRCQEIFITDLSICGGWRLRVKSDWNLPLRIRRAELAEQPHIGIHCLGEES